MNVRLFIAISFLACTRVGSAQDLSLGDVARQTKIDRSKAPTAKKIFTNEDEAPKAIAADEDPVEVVHSAALGLLHDYSHRCTLSRGKGGLAGDDSSVIEVSGPDRLHATWARTHPEPTQGELILIDNDAFSRQGRDPWKKTDTFEASRLKRYLPQGLQAGYKSGDLKLVGKPSIDGSPTFQYQYFVNDTSLNRTVNLWIGAYDGLPHKTEMRTIDKDSHSSYDESYSCTYGVRVEIKAPI